MESNDSPEIPDRGETSDIPGLPSGVMERKGRNETNLHEPTMVHIFFLKLFVTPKHIRSLAGVLFAAFLKCQFCS